MRCWSFEEVMMQGKIRHLYHYPIKGLSAQRLADVQLRRGQGFPFDRVFGLARHDSGFDVRDPRPLPKDRFIVLVKEERLAGLDTDFDPETRKLRIRIAKREAFEADLSTEEGMSRAVAFFSTMFDLRKDQRPIFAHSGAHRFTDVSVLSAEMMNAISLINLESVRDFEARIGRPVDPMRFRANIYFDGWPPFSELELVGKEITVGHVRLKIVMRTRRCAATEVNPQTARRDVNVPRLLMSTYDHPDMGVYAEVLDAGPISSGDPICCQNVG
jgi:uncharacterized protein